MKIKTRSILQELNAVASVRNIDALIESRALNVINSAINLLETIKQTYDTESAVDLERRLLNSIRGQDTAKFTRGIRKVAESRKPRNKLLENTSEET
jgi:hypothetical protein